MGGFRHKSVIIEVLVFPQLHTWLHQRILIIFSIAVVFEMSVSSQFDQQQTVVFEISCSIQASQRINSTDLVSLTLLSVG